MARRPTTPRDSADVAAAFFGLPPAGQVPASRASHNDLRQAHGGAGRDGQPGAPVGSMSAGDLGRGLQALSRMPGARAAAAAAATAAGQAGPDEIDDRTARRIRTAADAKAAEQARLAGQGRAARLPAVAGRPERVPPQTLPAVINRALAATADARGSMVPVKPRWVAVSRLPGYLQQGIRRMGRDLFRAFPDFQAVPLEDVQVLAHYQAQGRGAGPNTRQEVEALANWIVRNGVRDDTANLDFGDTFGLGYTPDIQVWNVPGASFMLVRERTQAGHVPVDGMCIYAVQGGRGVQLEQRPPAGGVAGTGTARDEP